MPYAPIRLFLCKSQTLSSPLCVGGGGGGGQHGGGGGGGGEAKSDTAKVKVSCGNHDAESCSKCGNAANVCNGECSWRNDKCVPKGIC